MGPAHHTRTVPLPRGLGPRIASRINRRVSQRIRRAPFCTPSRHAIGLHCRERAWWPPRHLLLLPAGVATLLTKPIIETFRTCSTLSCTHRATTQAPRALKRRKGPPVPDERPLSDQAVLFRSLQHAQDARHQTLEVLRMLMRCGQHALMVHVHRTRVVSGQREAQDLHP